MHQPSYKAAGFTLLELMVTLAMIAVLAGAAYAMYNEYVIEAKATEGVSLLLATGQSVASITTNKSCSAVEGIITQSGLISDVSVNGNYESKSGESCPTGCMATLTFNARAPRELRNKKLSANILNSGQMSLVTADTTLDPIYYQDVLGVVPRKTSDSCASKADISVQSTNGEAVNETALPKGVNLQPTSSNNILTSANGTTINVSPNQSVTLYAKASYKNTNTNQRYLTSGIASVGIKTGVIGASQNNAAIIYANPLIRAASDDTASLTAIAGFPFTGMFADRTSLQYSLAQTFYIDKNKHLISRILMDQSSNKAYEAYPSATIELMNEAINATTGQYTLEPRGISFTLKRISRGAKTAGMVFGYSALVDLGAMPNPAPTYLYTGWPNSILNKANGYDAEGVIKITFNKD